MELRRSGQGLGFAVAVAVAEITAVMTVALVELRTAFASSEVALRRPWREREKERTVAH